MTAMWKLVGIGVQLPITDGVPALITLTFGYAKKRRMLVFEGTDPISTWFEINAALDQMTWLTPDEIARVMGELPFGPPPDDVPFATE